MLSHSTPAALTETTSTQDCIQTQGLVGFAPQNSSMTAASTATVMIQAKQTARMRHQTSSWSDGGGQEP